MHVVAGIQEGSRPYVQPQLDGGAVQVAGMLGDAVLLLCTGRQPCESQQQRMVRGFTGPPGC